MKKSVKALLVSLGILLLAGCQTTEKVVVLTAPEGQNLYVRNTTIKTKNSVISQLGIDVTVNVEDGTLLRNPTVNYTLTSAKTGAENAENAKLYLETGSKRFSVKNEKVLYRDIVKNKLNTRITSEMEKSDFEELLASWDSVYVVLVLQNGTEIKMVSKELDDKFYDLRVIAK